MTLTVPKHMLVINVRMCKVLRFWHEISQLISCQYAVFFKSFLWQLGLERVGWGTFKEAKDNWIFSWFNCNPMYTLNLGWKGRVVGVMGIVADSHGNWLHGSDDSQDWPMSTVAGTVLDSSFWALANIIQFHENWELQQLHMSKPNMDEFGHPDSVTEEVFVRAQAVWYALG